MAGLPFFPKARPAKIAQGLARAGLDIAARAVQGSAAGQAIGMVAGALGLAPADLPDALANLTPKQREQLMELQVQMEQLDNDDRANARATLSDHWLMPWLSLGVVILTVAFGVVLLTVTIPDKNESLANVFVGALLSGWTLVLQYWFGSSRGSAQKSANMEQFLSSATVEKK